MCKTSLSIRGGYDKNHSLDFDGLRMAIDRGHDNKHNTRYCSCLTCVLSELRAMQVRRCAGRVGGCMIKVNIAIPLI